MADNLPDSVPDWLLEALDYDGPHSAESRTATMDNPSVMPDWLTADTPAAPESSPELPPESPIESPIMRMDWPELAAEVADCRRCGLCRGRQKTVFGVGDQQARWLFIGEGPGYYENLQGEPFVGRAGQLLDNMLASLGVARGQAAYIANVVKCRPTDASGKDRPPTPEEVASCLPYLQRQIELIAPQVLVALGKTAAVSLLGLPPETSVGQLRGKRLHYGSIPLIVTYHPAYLLRQPVEKRKAWQDLCLAKVALA